MNREQALKILRNLVANDEDGDANAEPFACCIELYACGLDGFEVFEAIKNIAREP